MAALSVLPALSVAQREVIEMLLEDGEPVLASEFADVRTIQELLGHGA